MNGRHRQQHEVDEVTGVCADRSATLRRWLGQADQDVEIQEDYLKVLS